MRSRYVTCSSALVLVGSLLIFSQVAYAAPPTTAAQLISQVCGLSLCGGVRNPVDNKIHDPAIASVTCPNATTVAFSGIQATFSPSAPVTCYNASRTCMTSILDSMNQLGVGFTTTDFDVPKLVTVTYNSTSSSGSTSTTTCTTKPDTVSAAVSSSMMSYMAFFAIASTMIMSML